MVKANTQQGLRIEYLPLGDLVQWPGNPKKHVTEKIQRSIIEFGFTSPLLLDETSGRIVAGHGRLEALQAMEQRGDKPPKRIVVRRKVWHVPVIRGLDFANEQAAAAYLLADNRLAELGGWDAKALEDMFAAFPEEFEPMTGFSADEIDKLLVAVNLSNEVPPKKTVQFEVSTKPESFAILIQCKSEDEQLDLLAELNKRGFDAKAAV